MIRQFIILANMAVATTALGGNWQSLLDNPPFGVEPKVSVTAQVVRPELRGILQEGNDFYFSIFDPETKQFSWVKKGDPTKEFMITEYDHVREKVVLQQGKNLVAISLKPIESTGPTGIALPKAGRGSVQIVATTGRLSSAPTEEWQRLERVSALVRQRRLRAKSVSTISGT